ncbi:DUF11 domain-containing protein [Shewanella salipaludis]|uniref:DUF11 domain-containing protein n=1 Tax=Shewanella salipaludis TaxID=2723052 RepID=A0A972FP97_9GAMM|nr:DUF11 domain-containing protein [Shewanella salipaludis]NMH63603.1 DUF11 domain-containing protein [Shewanella salipaludis]
MKITGKNSLLTKSPAFILGLAIGLFAPTTLAVHDEGIFELEGNAIQDSVAPPYDWETLYNGGLNNGGNTTAFTGIVNDEPNAQGIDTSIFTGGRKDIQPIAQWAHKAGSSPDKDEITNAYAAAYNNAAGDLLIYFGADRISNKGDAFMGFWFFKQHVEAKGDGSFEGEHTNGDVLVLTNFPQASGASPEIRVDIWDDSCSKAASNNPGIGECDAANIRLLHKSNAICGSAAGDLVCAITNDEDGPYDPTPSPWPYQSKNDNTANQFPYESIFEGGINLTQLVGGDNCFSSFMAETRSSSEFTATLKDFVLHDFDLCSVDITKVCSQAEVNATETGYVYQYEGKVINDGSGTLYNVVVTDSEAGNMHALGTILSGAEAPYSGSFESSSNGLNNSVTVTASGSPTGASTITDTAGDECEPLSLSPMIYVDKECSSSFVPTANGIIAEVSFSGQVCNTTTPGLTLVNVSVVDDSGTPGDPGDDVAVLSGITLGPDACMNYSGSYIPKDFANPINQNFRDTVLASGQLKLDGSSASNTASADCPICPSGN